MRISDWSSDVCSSDLVERPGIEFGDQPALGRVQIEQDSELDVVDIVEQQLSVENAPLRLTSELVVGDQRKVTAILDMVGHLTESDGGDDRALVQRTVLARQRFGVEREGFEHGEVRRVDVLTDRSEGRRVGKECVSTGR